MSFELAVRLTEILMALAFIQQSLEHCVGTPSERLIFGPRLLASLALLFGIEPAWVCLVLLFLGMLALHRFQGPYNGGSDRMSLLMISCLCAIHFLPAREWQEIFLGYFALQLMLSYVISGWVKIVNAPWRHGEALADVFRFSAYPVAEDLRNWAASPKLLFTMSWAVMLFELLFPLTLLHPLSLAAGLMIAGTFHLANACLFGLNRFFWIWLSAYPSIIWLQGRLF